MVSALRHLRASLLHRVLSEDAPNIPYIIDGASPFAQKGRQPRDISCTRNGEDDDETKLLAYIHYQQKECGTELANEAQTDVEMLYRSASIRPRHERNSFPLGLEAFQRIQPLSRRLASSSPPYTFSEWFLVLLVETR